MSAAAARPDLYQHLTAAEALNCVRAASPLALLPEWAGKLRDVLTRRIDAGCGASGPRQKRALRAARSA